MQTKDKDIQRLIEAIELSKQCVPSNTAFSVGAVLFDRNDERVSTGYSRETHERVHAEEVALQKVANRGISLQGGTIYSSLEPCGLRLSGKQSCADLIIEAGIRKVVFALREPPVFVRGTGADKLEAHGVEVVFIPELGHLVELVNQHLLTRQCHISL